MFVKFLPKKIFAHLFELHAEFAEYSVCVKLIVPNLIFFPKLNFQNKNIIYQLQQVRTTLLPSCTNKIAYDFEYLIIWRNAQMMMDPIVFLLSKKYLSMMIVLERRGLGVSVILHLSCMCKW